MRQLPLRKRLRSFFSFMKLPPKLGVSGCFYLPSTKGSHIPPGEKENHLQNAIFGDMLAPWRVTFIDLLLRELFRTRIFLALNYIPCKAIGGKKDKNLWHHKSWFSGRWKVFVLGPNKDKRTKKRKKNTHTKYVPSFREDMCQGNRGYSQKNHRDRIVISKTRRLLSSPNSWQDFIASNRT